MDSFLAHEAEAELEVAAEAENVEVETQTEEADDNAKIRKELEETRVAHERALAQILELQGSLNLYRQWESQHRPGCVSLRCNLRVIGRKYYLNIAYTFLY